VSLPQESPGSTGSSNPFNPAPGKAENENFVYVHRHTVIELCARYERLELTQEIKDMYLVFASPAIASRVGVSAAMRGVMFPSTGTLMSPMPSIKMKAIL